jgi:hypothetical protein
MGLQTVVGPGGEECPLKAWAKNCCAASRANVGAKLSGIGTHLAYQGVK